MTDCSTVLLTTSELILGSLLSVADEACPFLKNINTYVQTLNKMNERGM